MRALKSDRSARVIVGDHPFVQNLRRVHYGLGVEALAELRIAAALDELAHAI